MEQTIKIEVDSSDLDIALEKADRLRTCLKEVGQLLESIQVRAQEDAEGKNSGMVFTPRSLQTTGADLETSGGNTDQIMEGLTMRLKEWTERAVY